MIWDNAQGGGWKMKSGAVKKREVFICFPVFSFRSIDISISPC